VFGEDATKSSQSYLNCNKIAFSCTLRSPQSDGILATTWGSCSAAVLAPFVALI